MGLTLAVGGAKSVFRARFGSDLAGMLDNSFGAEGDWEGVRPRTFGVVDEAAWNEFKERAIATLGAENVGNLLALHAEGRGVCLPMSIRPVALPLHNGAPLRCVSLHGLRRELAELAAAWDLPLDDHALNELLLVSRDPDDGWVGDAPEIVAFARVVLAANDAVSRDCPLWFVGLIDAEELLEPAEPVAHS